MSCSCILCTTIKVPGRRTPAAGGGGSTGGLGGTDPFTLPAETTDDQERGLNKGLRQSKARNEAIKDGVIPRLNPPFPYRVTPPPLEYFRFPANPPETLAGE